MIGATGSVRVMVATKPVDFRKGAEGLAALVRETMQADPFSGAVYVFRAKRADRVKLIYWDGSGVCLFAKRLETGAFRWPQIEDGVIRLSSAAGAAPIASEALTRICALYEIESQIRGRDPDQRRIARQEKSRIIVDELESWLRGKLQMISQKTKLAEAIRYALSRWKGLTSFIDDGHIEIDSNVVERSIRPIALNRKNPLFAGSDGGGEHWAIIASLIETCKLCNVDPQFYLADVTTRIVNAHPNSRIDELLPWAYHTIPDLKAVA